jgi:hypothetical protein
MCSHDYLETIFFSNTINHFVQKDLVLGVGFLGILGKLGVFGFRFWFENTDVGYLFWGGK